MHQQGLPRGIWPRYCEVCVHGAYCTLNKEKLGELSHGFHRGTCPRYSRVFLHNFISSFFSIKIYVNDLHSWALAQDVASWQPAAKAKCSLCHLCSKRERGMLLSGEASHHKSHTHVCPWKSDWQQSVYLLSIYYIYRPGYFISDNLESFSRSKLEVLSEYDAVNIYC